MIILRQKEYSLFSGLFYKKNSTQKEESAVNKLPSEYYKLLKISEELRDSKFFKTEAFLSGYPEEEGLKYPHLIVLPEERINLYNNTTGDMPIVYIIDINGLGYNFDNSSWYTCEFKKQPKSIANLKQYLLSSIKKGIDRIKTKKLKIYELGALSDNVIGSKHVSELMSKEDYNYLIKYCEDLYKLINLKL